jgi:predicted RNA-binding Zn-ribbon protein involved in translation (DUF1610 family)
VPTANKHKTAATLNTNHTNRPVGVRIINARTESNFAFLRGDARAARVEPTVANSFSCWSCKRRITLAERSAADGNCPLCGVEIELTAQQRSDEANG